jgi:preprotein translocase SecE subunit
MPAENTLGEQPERRRRRTPAGKSREQLQREQAEGERAITRAKTRTEPAKRDDDEAEKKPGLVARFRDYIEGVQSEARKVIWPTQEDVRRLTMIVLTTLVSAAIVLGAIVLIFTELFRVGLAQPAILIGVMVVAGIAGLVFVRINRQRSSF